MTFSNIFQSKTLMASLLAGAFLMPTPASAQVFGGYGGNVLLGAGIGAGLGGVLGSNLAGAGVQQEGTVIGAVLGGIAGAAIMNQGVNRGVNRRSSRYGGYVPGFGPDYSLGYGYGYSGQGRHYSKPTPVPYSTFGGRYVNTNTGAGYRGQFIQPILWPGAQLGTQPGTQYIQGPNLVQVYTIPHVTQQVYYPPLQHITPTVHVTQALPAPTNVYCYAGSNKRYDRRGHKITAGNSACR